MNQFSYERPGKEKSRIYRTKDCEASILQIQCFQVGLSKRMAKTHPSDLRNLRNSGIAGPLIGSRKESVMSTIIFNLIRVSLILLFLIGCTSAPALSLTPASPTQAPRTSPLAEPTSAPMPDTWTDDFNGALAAGWNWANEDPTHWSLKDTPGALRILTQSESLYKAGNPKNLLLRDASAGDFEIITQVTFDPRDNFQQAAILIYQDEDNFVLLNRGFCGVRGCPGSGIFLDNVINRQLDHANSPRKDSSLQTTWLKLQKDGIQYIGFYSTDGQTWDELGRVENPMTPAKVGLTANNSNADPYAPQIPADFDSFTVQRTTFGE